MPLRRRRYGSDETASDVLGAMTTGMTPEISTLARRLARWLPDREPPSQRNIDTAQRFQIWRGPGWASPTGAEAVYAHRREAGGVDGGGRGGTLGRAAAGRPLCLSSRSDGGLLGLTSRIDRGPLPWPPPFALPPLNASLRLALTRGPAVRRFLCTAPAPPETFASPRAHSPRVAQARALTGPRRARSSCTPPAPPPTVASVRRRAFTLTSRAGLVHGEGHEGRKRLRFSITNDQNSIEGKLKSAACIESVEKSKNCPEILVTPVKQPDGDD